MGSVKRRAFSSALVLALAVPLLTTSASAVEGAPDWAYAMAHELMSPYCPGRTLAECPSPNAAELRFWILNQAAAGVSEEEVREMLAQRFGDVLLAAPRAEGWGLSAYAVPIAAFVVGLPIALWVIRRLTGGGGEPEKPAAPSSEPKAPVDPELERQLERELAEY
ncbi:MAG: cytochrome c-type biogenesis protein CcmH [Myxococcota bacterium]|jgi:cytochrome c-type biogenesis protein CcmH/NrfF|nr:cytochrome c-type biogenesis protein CcmH [Myxococcota bacterium]